MPGTEHGIVRNTCISANGVRNLRVHLGHFGLVHASSFQSAEEALEPSRAWMKTLPFELTRQWVDFPCSGIPSHLSAKLYPFVPCSPIFYQFLCFKLGFLNFLSGCGTAARAFKDYRLHLVGFGGLLQGLNDKSPGWLGWLGWLVSPVSRVSLESTRSIPQYCSMP